MVWNHKSTIWRRPKCRLQWWDTTHHYRNGIHICICINIYIHIYTEKTIFSFPFTVNRIWSWGQFSFRFLTKLNSVWFKIERKTVRKCKKVFLVTCIRWSQNVHFSRSHYNAGKLKPFHSYIDKDTMLSKYLESLSNHLDCNTNLSAIFGEIFCRNSDMHVWSSHCHHSKLTHCHRCFDKESILARMFRQGESILE